MRDGSEEELGEIVRLRFYKDKMQPATEVSGKAFWAGNASDVLGVKLTVNNKLVHFGYADYIKVEAEHGRQAVSLHSSGWSKLLAQNEPVPGLNYNLDLEGLLRANTAIPNVSCESGTDTVNYIYVKEHSTIWDAVTAYAQKAYARFPYIRGDNTVTVKDHTGTVRSYAAERVISIGSIYDRRTILSRAYMADADGQYSYYSDGTAALADGIVRERYYPLDRQWLASPQDGTRVKAEGSERRYGCLFAKVIGYSGEDIMDFARIEAGGMSFVRKIEGIEVMLEKGRAVTTFYHWA